MANGVYARIEPVKAASARRPLDDVPAQPKRLELPKRNDPVLLGGQRGDRAIARRRGWMRFCAHSAPEVIPPPHHVQVEVEMQPDGLTNATKAWWETPAAAGP